MPDPFDPLSYTDPAAYEEKKRREQMLAMGLPPQVRTSSGSPIQNFHPAVQAYLAQNQPGQQAPPSHLVEAIQRANSRPMPRMGHVSGFGNMMGDPRSPMDQSRTINVEEGGVPTGIKTGVGSNMGGLQMPLTASQKRQLAVPQQPKSFLQQAIDGDMPFGTAEDKNQRAFGSLGEKVPGGGKMFGQRTRAFMNPDGSVTLIGGKEFVSGKDYAEQSVRGKQSKESAQVMRRMANVEERIKRKNAMEDKLAANRAAKAAAHKAKNTPEFASSEPKSAVQAGMQAVFNAVKQNPALKFNEQSKVAIYQTAVQDYENTKKLNNELKQTELTQQGFGKTNFADLLKILAPGLMTNPDNTFVDQATMMERFAAAAPLIGAFQAMMGGNGGVPQVAGTGPATAKPPTPTEAAKANEWISSNLPESVREQIEDERTLQEKLLVLEKNGYKAESKEWKMVVAAHNGLLPPSKQEPAELLPPDQRPGASGLVEIKPPQRKKLPGLAGALGLHAPSWPF